MISEQYQWLKEMLIDEFGASNVQEIMGGAGRDLMYMVHNDQGRNVLILAEHTSGSMIIGDYLIDVEENGALSDKFAVTDYRLNGQPDKIDQIKDVIKIAREAWAKPKEGNNNGKVSN